jgi:hypothetical protein
MYKGNKPSWADKQQQGELNSRTQKMGSIPSLQWLSGFQKRISKTGDKLSDFTKPGIFSTILHEPAVAW